MRSIEEMDKKIIIGKHPLAKNLIQQYEDKGCRVDHQMGLTVDSVEINDYNELCLLADEGEDDLAIVMLERLAEQFDVEAHGGKKLVCHLMLLSNLSLQMLQTCDLNDMVRQKIDVYPFTLDEVWSRSIILDYKPMTIQSEQHVHLVIFGMGEIAKMVAIQAALVAHFPNYVRNHALRTRITMIDVEAEKQSRDFVKIYQHLFDNSYYRIVKPSEENPIIQFHKPMYDGMREDFVDVEWEFVDAESWDANVCEKLRLWANDHQQLLTVVMADKDCNKNKRRSLLMPSDIYQQSIPVYIYGEQKCGYDVTLPLVRMAKNVNYIYNKCYNDNVEDWTGALRYSVEIDPEERENLWSKLSNVKRMSSIYNAMTIPTKMRSIGLREDEWDHFYDIPQQNIELLAQVEHNRWSVEELILGFRPCTNSEQEIIAADVATQKDVYKSRKVHYDLRAYNDLRPDKTGRGVQVYDLCLSSCLPLIAKAFADDSTISLSKEGKSKGGEI